MLGACGAATVEPAAFRSDPSALHPLGGGVHVFIIQGVLVRWNFLTGLLRGTIPCTPGGVRL